MHLAIITAVYPPEREPAGYIMEGFARQFARDGDRVTVLAPFPNRPEGRLYPGWRRSLGLQTHDDGLEILHCPSSLVGPRRRPIARVLENFTFGLSSSANLMRIGRPDVVVLQTWPLFATHLNFAAAACLSAPVVYYVQDCYPEALFGTGWLRSESRLGRLLLWWDALLSRKSAAVVAISPQMAKLIASARAVPSERVAVVQNWLDPVQEPSVADTLRHRARWSAGPRTFVALFAGTLGFVSGAGILVDAALMLRDRPDVLLVCVGDGPLKSAMQNRAAAIGLRNIVFEPFLPRFEVPSMHAAADAFLATMQLGYTEASFPSKVVSYLRAGRPIVCSAPPVSGLSELVSSAEAGIVTPAGDARALASALLRLADSPETRTKLGRNGKSYYDRTLTFQAVYPGFRALVHRVLRIAPPSSPALSPRLHKHF